MRTEGEKWLSAKLRGIQRLEGYSLDDPVEEVAKRLEFGLGDVVKLNANENLFIPREKLLELLREVVEEWDPRVYPQEEERGLKEKLADYLSVSPGQIVVGNGSDELIQQITQLLEDHEQALSVEPTFSMYRHSVSARGAEYVCVPLRNDFSLDSDRILRAMTPRSRILFLCSPNNPTANQFGTDDVRSLVKDFPGLVIIDEAYVEFAGHSMLSLLNEFENVIVLRTFSKAFGLAGLRLGYAVASSEFAETCSERVQGPFPVSSFTLRVGAKMLSHRDIVDNAIEQLKAEREKLIQRLNEVDGIKAFDSQTNFVLFQTSTRSDRVRQRLVSKGVLVKNLGEVLHLKDCLRATVGLPQMNVRLLDALEEILREDVSPTNH